MRFSLQPTQLNPTGLNITNRVIAHSHEGEGHAKSFYTHTQLDKLKQDQKSIFCCLFNYTKHMDEPESNLKKKGEQKKPGLVQLENKLHIIMRKCVLYINKTHTKRHESLKRSPLYASFSGAPSSVPLVLRV